ncbi:LytTR family transcriptional regulator DNA-binding domain-containing protein [Vagococcus sp. BWB3-3]|uniref:LytTR family transcriptional regulator DNA-binding domain-containing protein n=1 Tax=Vagococcus allomyrinae TaxID=2794353 RepID=A0A940P6L6_9ENTE|nr:LytTR family DNA-binding domain-containing protein [Vagococcus allomyrinae]MBP1042589.1 LytTR family transcriptional regulator DNA-binding domain-containing protein [Vagococcus allomyrinae]
MKIIIDNIEESAEEYVSFHVYHMTDRISQAISHLKETVTHIVGERNEELYTIAYEAILYIETVDKKSFLYTEEHVYSLRDKLYQLEEKLAIVDCIRVSKSMILNIDKIDAVYPTISGRFEARLVNQERVTISRSYVTNLKNKLGIGKDKS